MKWTIAAEGSGDWARVVVDNIPYMVSRKKAEMRYEGKDPSQLHLLLAKDKHRRGLCDKAAIVHRENPEKGWSSERPDVWSVHYGSKSMKVKWDGSIPSEDRSNALREEGSAKMSPKKDSGKAKSLAAAALAGVKRKADLLDEIAKTMGKTRDQLTADDIKQAHDQAVAMLPSTQQPAAPVEPAADPSMTPPSNPPLAPGASSVSIRWMRSAGDNPFEKKDDKADDKKEDKDEEKKDDKKAPPFGKKDEKSDDKPKDEKKDDKAESKEPKKDKKPAAPKKDKPAAPKKDAPKDESKGDEKDAKEAEEAIEILEKLMEKEKAEGEPHAQELAKALELVKKFLVEEEHEHDGPAGPKDPMPGIPVTVDLPIVGPSAPSGPVKPPMPKSPMPPAMPMAAQDIAGFREGDAVWHKEASGSEYEPGRVIALGNGKIVVDWGDADGVPAEYSPEDLVMASARADEGNLFAQEASSEDLGVAEENLPDEKSEIETILAGISVKDLLEKKSSDGSNKNAIRHLATGKSGEFLANGSDGRCLVRFDGEETFVYPYEIKFDGDAPLF